MANNTLYWHDYEATGIDTSRDRPIQFAGIRTDEALNIVGEPLNIFARLADDVLPHPMATLVTGITPQMAQEKGVAILVNRPFVNGDYFDIVRDRELPEWAAEFDCESWAQFSLKFILSHPAVTCVLTETANPKHLVDNLGAGMGRLPDEATRARMQELVQSFA